MSHNLVFHARTKHYHFIREKVTVGSLWLRYLPTTPLWLRYLPTTRQIANVFTKLTFAKGLFFHYLFQTWRSFSINARGVCDKNHVLTTTTNQAKNHVMIINLSKKTLLNAQHWFMGSKQIYHHWLHNSISYFMFFMSTHIYRLYLAKWAKNWKVNCT